MGYLWRLFSPKSFHLWLQRDCLLTVRGRSVSHGARWYLESVKDTRCQSDNGNELRTPWSNLSWGSSKEIPHILWISEVQYRFHKRPWLFPILNQITPIHAPHYILSYNYFNIIIKSAPRSFKWSFSLGFTHQNPVSVSCPVPHVLRASPFAIFLILSP